MALTWVPELVARAVTGCEDFAAVVLDELFPYAGAHCLWISAKAGG